MTSTATPCRVKVDPGPIANVQSIVSLSWEAANNSLQTAQAPLAYVIPFIYHFATIQKVVIIGDPAQLPPHGTSFKNSVRSLFGAFLQVGGQPIFLDEQRRVPGPIANVQSVVSYQGKLRTIPCKEGIAVKECLFWIDIKGHEEKQGDSFVNFQEIQGVRTALLQSRRRFQSLRPTIVLSFYAAQLRQRRYSLRKEFTDVTFGTVDSIQGQEGSQVILSLVRTETRAWKDY
jgi:superfamily I DNA and/or RNA helicase